ncbi:oxidoreductase [Rhizobium laguerreae]|uniref:oxidoreductase n=1 Tax=Rhizobium laguerreae TaxID=1076926 RepID=UPI001C91BE74|nr:oxidoreductase [Rhizobium laguerreae]
MPTPKLSDELAQEAADAFDALRSKTEAALLLGISRTTFNDRLKIAAERGMCGTKPVLPGFRIAQISNTPNGDYIKQKPERGESWALPDGHAVKGVSALVDADGRTIQQWVKTNKAAEDQMAAFRAMVDALKEDLPRLEPIAPPEATVADRMNQFIVTDSHFGMLAWAEETGADYDLRIAEQLLLDWFAASIAGAPLAHTAVFAQLGDLMHHDALESITPAHHHVLDADSRLQKIIRVVIRTIRRAIAMLLARHQNVHVVMASGNHDPASSAWLREMLAVMYEDEPRIKIDNSPSLYYCHVWGDTLNLYHHGHKADVNTVDRKFAAEFRREFGMSRFAYGHIGHKHSDEGIKTSLMYIERHETLAGRDAYAASGPWMSGRSAKRITYDKRFGEVDRARMTPEMVAGKYAAANDNEPVEQRRAA